MADELGPIQTMRFLCEKLDIDLGTAKAMVQAQRSKNIHQELVGLRDLIVTMRELLVEVAQSGALDPPAVADLEKRINTVCNDTEEFNAKDLKGNSWSNDWHAQRR